MSKPVVNRREKILDKALEMFNERGVEYVGLRELAAMLDMRVSNITYYFPTKDDLVYELAQQLRKTNAAIMVTTDQLTMEGFLQMMHRVFQNHVRFRCLLLSVVHLLKQNRHMADEYTKTQDIRNSTMLSNLKELARGGYLVIEDRKKMEFLVSTLSLIARFWISEAAVSKPGLNTGKQVLHYLNLVTSLLSPYATPKAKKEIAAFLEAL